MLSSVKSTVFYVTSGDFLLLLKPGCFIHTVQVITAVLWDLSCSAVDDFCIASRKSIRRIFNLPYQTHGWLPAAPAMRLFACL